MSIVDASTKYLADYVPLIVIGGAEYGSGFSKDWTAKGTLLLGAKAVLAASFERIHRSNLIGMGVLPLQLLPDWNAETLGLGGEGACSIIGLAGTDTMPDRITVKVTHGGTVAEFVALVRIDTPAEADYFRHGGILQYVLHQLLPE